MFKGMFKAWPLTVTMLAVIFGLCSLVWKSSEKEEEERHVSDEAPK